MEEIVTLRKQLMLAQRALRREFDADFAPRMSIPLSPLECMIFNFMGETGSDSASEVIGEFNLNKSTLSETFFALEKKGLIESFTSDEDKRKKRLVITEKGWRFFEELRRIDDDFEKRIASSLGGESKRQELLALLSKVSNALGAERN